MKLKRLFIASLAVLFISACGSRAYYPSPEELQERRERLAKAEAMFQERCKKAGEFIYRTAENVEGIFILKLRPKDINYRDQYKMDDPYGSDTGGIGYIENFLRGRDAKQSLVDQNGVKNGYLYVDAIGPDDGKRYRYTSRMDEPWQRDKSYEEGYMRFIADRVPAPDSAPRYGVTYDDISTREERDYWIAGSSLRVIDLKTNEVMAERIGYMFDPGQGSDSGGRSPWLSAASYACPIFRPANAVRQPDFVYQMFQTRNFVEKVLHIKQSKKEK